MNKQAPSPADLAVNRQLVRQYGRRRVSAAALAANDGTDWTQEGITLWQLVYTGILPQLVGALAGVDRSLARQCGEEAVTLASYLADLAVEEMALAEARQAAADAADRRIITEDHRRREAAERAARPTLENGEPCDF